MDYGKIIEHLDYAYQGIMNAYGEKSLPVLEMIDQVQYELENLENPVMGSFDEKGDTI